MIHIHNLCKQFGTQIVFANASAHIPPHTRVGLVGPNGAGKTTLFRLLTGEEQPDAGSIVLAKGARLGHLKQEVWDNAARSILAEVLAGFPELQALEQNLIELEAALSADPNQELMARYGALRQRFEALGGYAREHEAKKILSGIGFSPAQFGQPLHTFSGGWMMRVALAKLLLSKPDILLLDEPTNHLDLEAIVWLEDFLLDYPGTLVLTTHDQVFMQRIAGRILEISNRQLVTYLGDFESYAEQKAARREQLEAQFKNQQKKIEQTERFIERFRYKATKARQVQSRIKMLARMERVQVETETARAMKFRLPQPERSGVDVVTLRGVMKRYGEKVVYRKLDFHLARGEKVALLGPNGAGKSTLLKIVAGVLPIEDGERSYGHNVTVEYYAQHQLECLNPAATVYEEIAGVTGHLLPEQRRALLGAFLFSGEEVFKPVAVLSGGEKARLALAKMLARPANLLVLDEPTNHLDILSRQVLEDALTDYEGTLLFISHDRAFINAIATKVVEVINGELTIYPGTYDDFVWRKQQFAEAASPAAASGENGQPRPAAANQTKKDERRARAERIQQKSRELRPLKQHLAALEAEIAGLEKEKAELLQAVCDPAIIANREIYPQKLRRQREVDNRLEALMAEWTELSMKVEAVEAEYGD
ncbi:MAG: ABC-F family ATP-binding cassette domain-containing protein [candidate division KSB1 bacterium]|nr:ABC-F family ATP-binding cassette domain-containing protein [candidate division KSB1 bacterium]MDZ7275711.1 ABC-F family ATP-binding cassette domain-containing protein [candidate division KSB1 bacterium]MDZ7284598.1 ABC-F family ATP-binding cassette domain-containing protein [candidate division KSB1 bacterium]MDZ7297983.1 ABC-F family ATP-binding cassette domain-containing protein [candidate division KSB1 bacterium]MDZ7305849.1 ABC-F family ATP-binding cassette domain-containing protein [can